MSLSQLREERDAHNTRIRAIFEEAGPDRDFSKVKSVEGSTQDKVDEVQRLAKLSAEAGAKIDEQMKLDGIEAAAKSAPASLGRFVGGTDVVGDPTPKGLKSFEDYFEGSVFGKAGSSDSKRGKSFEYAGTLAQALNSIKTTITLASGVNNEATRLPGIVPSAQEDRTVADLLLQGTTDNNTLAIVTETTFTNAGTTVAEGAAKPESALAFTRATLPVEKIATWIPATDELLEDVAGIRSYIEGRLIFMVKRVEEVQLLTGNGTTPNIRGLNNATGVQTQAKGADPVPDAIYKAMTLIRNTGFAEPTFAVFHPNDWQDVKLLRTADGIYIWGSPSAAEGPDRIWGLEVRVTTAQTENTALVGSRDYAQIFRRKGITVTASTEHASYFTSNLIAILAEERLTMAIYRGSAFCKVTGV